MPECPKKTRCPLFPLFQSVENLEVWQHRYCNNRYQECERFKLAMSGTRPDDDLLPNGSRLRSRPYPEADNGARPTAET